MLIVSTSFEPILIMLVLVNIFFVYLAHFQMHEMITEFPVSLHGLFFWLRCECQWCDRHSRQFHVARVKNISNLLRPWTAQVRTPLEFQDFKITWSIKYQIKDCKLTSVFNWCWLPERHFSTTHQLNSSRTCSTNL